MAAALAFVLPLTACVPFSRGSSQPSPEPTAPVEPPAFDLLQADELELDHAVLDPDHAVLALLDHADAWLAVDSLARASAAYQQILDMEEIAEWDSSGRLRARALWGLALTALIGHPAPNTEQARTLLRTLEAFEQTPEGVLARWMGGILDEVSRLRTHAAQQDEQIRILNATVERLKQIDLNRRPGGPEPPRPGTN